MIIKKITEGYVIQTFDTDLGRFVSQEFIAGGQCQYEDEDGEPVDSKEMGDPEPYLPYDMAPLNASTVEGIRGEEAK